MFETAVSMADRMRSLGNCERVVGMSIDSMTPPHGHSERVDTLIVGAGLSGLRAAKILEDGGQRVRVLEAKDRVGGRVLTESFAGGTVDLGAQWVGPQQHRIMALLAHLGIGTFPTAHEGRKVLAIGSKGEDLFRNNSKMSPLALVSLQWTIHRLERLADGASAEDVFKTEAGRIQDGLTVGEWVRRHVWLPRGAHRIEYGCAGHLWR